jgi:O-glycosyl hydrolase
MMKRILFAWIIVLICSSQTLMGQATGYVDWCDGPVKFQDHPYFHYQQNTSEIRIEVAVPQGARWQGCKYAIGETLDLSGQPIIGLTMQTDFEAQLTVYLFDAAGLYKTKNLKIKPGIGHIHYSVDFAGTSSIDLKRITHLQLTPNGNTTGGVSGVLLIDEIRAGDRAVNYAGVSGLTEKGFFINSVNNSFLVTDLSNAAFISTVGGSRLTRRVGVSAIDNGTATVVFDAQPDLSGRDTLLISVHPQPGYQFNTVKAAIRIEDNAPPTINPLDHAKTAVGDTLTVALTGLSDGNATTEQTLRISAASDNQAALPDRNLRIHYTPFSTTAELMLTPIAPAPQIGVTLTLDDGFGRNSITQTRFTIDCFQQFNHPPTLDVIPNQFILQSSLRHTLVLTGIGDGDAGAQSLKFALTSSDSAMLAPGVMSLNHTAGAPTAALSFLPAQSGKTRITVVVTDNGGNSLNNGDASVERSFLVEVAAPPPNGHVVPIDAFTTGSTANLDGPGDWKIEDHLASQRVELGLFHGKSNALKLTLNNKTCWTGTWYQFNELDLSQHRYLCYDIYFEGSSFSNGGRTHSYFWDVNENRNLPRAHELRKTIPAGQWRTVVLDFRGSGGMNNDKGEEINVQRVNRVLFNYASGYDWPFPVDRGNVYLANIRIGSAVPDSLLPAVRPVCTIHPIAQQTWAAGAGEYRVRLTGVSSGPGYAAAPIVTAVSSDVNVLPHPHVSQLQLDGTVDLLFRAAVAPGTATVTVTVSANGADSFKRTFSVMLVNEPGAAVVPLVISPAARFQTMRGFGTFSFSDRPHYIDYYTRDLGASALRIGLIGNQAEPVNDNDHAQVLNLSAFDAGAFDFDFYRRLKDRGVETFILTSWSPPAWMKRNLSLSYGYAEAPQYDQTDNVLEPYYYDEFAESLAGAIKLFQQRAGIELYAVGPQNEPSFNEPYPSAVINPPRLTELAAVIGRRFEQEGLLTKLYLPEQVFSQSHYSMEHYINALAANADADQRTAIIATHGYDEDGVGEKNPTFQGWTDLWNATRRCRAPKELWMTETYPEFQNWSSALSLAGAIHGAVTYGHVSLWTLWDIEGTLMIQGKPTASFYTSKNYYKYIRPGAVRVKAEENHENLLASAFRDDTNHRLTIVLINTAAQPLLVATSGDSIPANFDMYLTAEHINFAAQGKRSIGQTIILPAYSVVTLVGDYEAKTGVDERNFVAPAGFALAQNYPNPFNPSTSIEFSLARTVETHVTVYSVLGQRVRSLADGVYSDGQHQLLWHGNDDFDRPVAGGLYFIKLETPHWCKTIKCLLLK